MASTLWRVSWNESDLVDVPVQLVSLRRLTKGQKKAAPTTPTTAYISMGTSQPISSDSNCVDLYQTREHKWLDYFVIYCSKTHIFKGKYLTVLYVHSMYIYEYLIYSCFLTINSILEKQKKKCNSVRLLITLCPLIVKKKKNSMKLMCATWFVWCCEQQNTSSKVL